MPNYPVNYSYLNKTPNKDNRNGVAITPKGVILHETAGFGALEHLMNPNVEASYTHLITRNGTVYVYVDMLKFVAWHAGVKSSYFLNGQLYKGYDINYHFYGISLEGMNDGTPITAAQQSSLRELLVELALQWGWTIDSKRFTTHKIVAPGYKTDPKGINYLETLQNAEDTRLARLNTSSQYYIVATPEANVRQAPNREAPIAKVLTGGFSFGAKPNGNGWVWLESGEGFVSADILSLKIQQFNKNSPIAYNVSMTKDAWNAVLKTTPLMALSDRLYTICLSFNIDPAVALAFLMDYPIEALKINWGGVQSAVKPSRVLKYTNGKPIFKTWEDALIDWCERMHIKYWELGYKTIDQVDQRYFGNKNEERLRKKIERIQSYNEMGR